MNIRREEGTNHRSKLEINIFRKGFQSKDSFIYYQKSSYNTLPGTNEKKNADHDDAE